MSRERTDTAGSSNSFGLRERTNTSGSVEFGLETRGPSNTYHEGSPRGRLAPPIFSSSSPTRLVATTTTASPSSSLSSSNQYSQLRAWVDWLQRQPVPSFLVPTVQRILKSVRPRTTRSSISHSPTHKRVSSGSGGNPNEAISGTSNEHDPDHQDDDTDDDFDNDDKKLFCIRGLDRVVFGTTAAADCVYVVGIQPPRYLWYMVSGAICDVFQLLVDVTLHNTLFPNNLAACWMTSFVVSIAARHSSHRYLVFGDYVPTYWQSLGRMYTGYSISIVLSTMFNYLITAGVARVSHYVAYAATLAWTGLANYFILKRLWKMGGPAASSSSKTMMTTTTTSNPSAP